MVVNNILSKLNAQQKKAVLHGEGPILVIAGAGTGKTRVITHRVAYLVEQGLAQPEQIVALTFTDKAAEEMQNRVDDLMPLGYAEMHISTFHKFCERILRESGLEIGLDTNFQILSKAEQWLLVKENLYTFELDYYRPLGNPYRFIDALLTNFSRAKDEIVMPKEYLQWAQEQAAQKGLDEAGKEESEKHLEVAKAYAKYQELLIQDSAQTKLDFGDLILYTISLLRARPSVLKRYREKFRYILVDEFQDTNYAQNELVKLLANDAKNVMVVGDDDQSIYRFRGAAVSNILQFQKDFPKAACVVLTQNYRSTQQILDRSYQLIQNNNPDRLESKANIDKKLISNKADGRLPAVLHAESIDAETEIVARTILDLKGAPMPSLPRDTGESKSEEAQMDLFAAAQQSEATEEEHGLKWSDFAILARANNHLEPFIQTLRYRGIPFQLVGSRGLYVRDEIKDLIAFLRVLVDPGDSMQLYRLMSMRLMEFDPKHLLFMLKWSKKQNYSLYETFGHLDQLRAISDQTKQKTEWLYTLIEECRSSIRQKDPGQLLLDFIQEIGLSEYYQQHENLENIIRINNIRLFFDQIKRYLAEHDERTVAGFVDFLDTMIEAGDNPATVEVNSSSDAVYLMTVHAAKGLEFEHVFLVNLVESRFPTRDRSDPIPLPDDFIKETLPEGDEHLQEERRLFYVGMTRARSGLYLCYGDDYGGVRKKKPSLFISEALGEDYMKIAVAESIDPLVESEAVEAATLELDLTPFLPHYYSYSQLYTFENCPLQFKYGYIYKLPTKMKGPLTFGQSIHETLKDFYEGIGRGEDTTLSYLLELLEKNWKREGYDSPEEVEKQHARAVNLLTKFYKGNEASFRPAAYLEEFVVFKAGQYSITGKIDRIDKLADGSYEVIDYKTGAMDDREKLVEKVKKDEQLSFYALACREVLHLDVSKYTLYYLEPGLRASAARTAAQLEAQEQKIVQTADKIRRSKFPPDPSPWKCKYCRFNPICPYSEV